MLYNNWRESEIRGLASSVFAQQWALSNQGCSSTNCEIMETLSMMLNYETLYSVYCWMYFTDEIRKQN